jgi:uncharacterized membrane protein YtjA (UPF0391 family)
LQRASGSNGTVGACAAFPSHDPVQSSKGNIMLGWALGFLVVALIAALFGFGGLASASAGIAQILFFVFVALFVITLVVRAVQSGRR